MTTPMRRRLRGITSNLNALRSEPALHLRLNLLELLVRARFEAHDEDGLGVRCADESPAIAEQNTYAVDSYHLVFAREIILRLFHDPELLVIRAFDPDLRRGNKARHVSEQLADCFSGVGQDVEEARSPVKRVVEAIKSFGEEHVARHLPSNRRVSLVHLLFDQGVSGLPHHRNSASFLDGLCQRLGSLDVKHDRLALARTRQYIARIDDEEIIAPDDLALLVDHADAVRVSIDCDPDVGTIFLHGCNQGLDVLGDRRVGVMIRKGSVALAVKTPRLDAKLRK